MSWFKQAAPKDPNQETFLKLSASLWKSNEEKVQEIDYTTINTQEIGSEKVNAAEVANDGEVRTIAMVFDKNGKLPFQKSPHHCMIKVMEGKVVDSVKDEVFNKGEVIKLSRDQENFLISPMGAKTVMFSTNMDGKALDLRRKKEYIPSVMRRLVYIFPKLTFS